MPNARWSESQRACGALKLIHEPYDGQVAWDWVATELFSTLFSRDGGYVVDAKRNALWHMRGQHPVPEHVLASVASQWMILYKEQWWTIYERRSGDWVKRVRLNVGEPTQRQLLGDIVRPVNYSRTPPRKTVKAAKRRLRTGSSLRAGSIVQYEREPAVRVGAARPTRPSPPVWGPETNQSSTEAPAPILPPSHHETPEVQYHSTLNGNNDVRSGVEKWEDEVDKENMGSEGNKQHLDRDHELKCYTLERG